jgi:hypothetical protein
MCMHAVSTNIEDVCVERYVRPGSLEECRQLGSLALADDG